MTKAINPINQRIARYRILAGYTQETAAEMLGINKNTYARMERSGNPKPEILKQLAELFNVPVQVFFYGENIPYEPTPVTPQPSFNKQEYIPEGAEPPFTLTLNEKNMIKIFRGLSKENKEKVFEALNKLIKSK